MTTGRRTLLSLSLVLLVFAASPVRADFAAGMKAFNSGDYDSARREFTADRNAKTSGKSAYYLATMYEEGKGVKQDIAEAAKLYRQSADRGVAAAQYNLAVLSMQGRGVSQNTAEGVKLIRASARKGYPPAESALGLLYADGKAVKQDWKEAVKWTRKAAEKGYPPAQLDLGKMYYRGRVVDGVPNKREAVKWIRRAADQGYAPAIEALKSLGE